MDNIHVVKETTLTVEKNSLALVIPCFNILTNQCGLCNESYYGEYLRNLYVRIGEHIGISTLTKKQVKLKNSSVADHLLFCNHSASYYDFSILTRENKNVLLELKESLLIMRDKPSLNRNITSAPLYLFDRH